MAFISEADIAGILETEHRNKSYRLAAAPKRSASHLHYWMTEASDYSLHMEENSDGEVTIRLMVEENLPPSTTFLLRVGADTAVVIKPDGKPIILSPDIATFLPHRPLVEMMTVLIQQNVRSKGELSLIEPPVNIKYVWAEELTLETEIPPEIDFALGDSEGIWELGRQCREIAKSPHSFHSILLYSRSNVKCLFLRKDPVV
jgi:hypothetical protein